MDNAGGLQGGNRLTDVYRRLLDCYGQRHWWPAKTPYEVCVGAVLTQNTNWGNVEKAIANFGDRLTPEAVSAMPMDALIEKIRPSGFYNQKSIYLKAVTAWYQSALERGLGTSPQRGVGAEPQGLNAERQSLLAVKGVGRETADSILLYAFGLPTFVVDAYTMRLLGRLGMDLGKAYERVRAAFMAALPADAALYNEYHALVVVHAKERCRAKPVCGGCPLGDICEVTAGVNE